MDWTPLWGAAYGATSAFIGIMLAKWWLRYNGEDDLVILMIVPFWPVLIPALWIRRQWRRRCSSSV